jgi:hypothetical protein
MFTSLLSNVLFLAAACISRISNLEKCSLSRGLTKLRQSMPA